MFRKPAVAAFTIAAAAVSLLPLSSAGAQSTQDSAKARNTVVTSASAGDVALPGPSGDPASATQLAMLRDRPWLGDTTEALSLYYSAAAQGYAPAMSRLGIRYEVRGDWLDAAFWFHLAADRGDHYAIHALPAADSGAAQLARGGVTPDRAFEIAARHDSLARHVPRAGVPRSVVLVAPAAAQRGEPMAERWLGQMYATGTGVVRSDSLAERWLRAAAKGGDVEAQAIVAAHDAGTLSGWDPAATAPEQTSSGAVAEASAWLGHVYLEGLGVARDDSSAARWFTRAARAGSDDARNALGVLYAAGRGVPRDSATAYALLTLGRAAATPETKALRASLAIQLSKDQLDRARAVAAEWAPDVTH